MRRYEHQARTARKRPERQTDAVPVRRHGTAVSQTNQRSMEQNLHRGTGKQTVKVGRNEPER